MTWLVLVRIMKNDLNSGRGLLLYPCIRRVKNCL